MALFCSFSHTDNFVQKKIPKETGASLVTRKSRMRYWNINKLCSDFFKVHLILEVIRGKVSPSFPEAKKSEQ